MVQQELTNVSMEITVGNYNFAFGYVGAEFEFKFTLTTYVNANTILRIYLPNTDFVNIGGGSLTMTMGSGTISAYDAATSSIKVSGIWSSR